MSRVAYRIRVARTLPERFFEDLARLTVAVDPVSTTLRADLNDQAELNGLLDALRREGLVLLKVRREHVLDFDDSGQSDDTRSDAVTTSQDPQRPSRART